MKLFLQVALGAALGTLLYTGFLGSTQEADWGRAIFVGIGCGCGAVFWPRKKPE